MGDRCADCVHWARGYRLQGMKVPDFCSRHFHSQHGDDPACDQFDLKDAPITPIRSEAPCLTARQIIEARLGRPLGPIATMPRDLRRALYLLARQLVRKT